MRTESELRAQLQAQMTKLLELRQQEKAVEGFINALQYALQQPDPDIQQIQPTGEVYAKFDDETALSEY